MTYLFTERKVNDLSIGREARTRIMNSFEREEINAELILPFVNKELLKNFLLFFSKCSVGEVTILNRNLTHNFAD